MSRHQQWIVTGASALGVVCFGAVIYVAAEMVLGLMHAIGALVGAFSNAWSL